MIFATCGRCEWYVIIVMVRYHFSIDHIVSPPPPSPSVIWYYDICDISWYQITSPGSRCLMGGKECLLWICTGLSDIGEKKQGLCIQQGFSFLSSMFYHPPSYLQSLPNTYCALSFWSLLFPWSITFFSSWQLCVSCSCSFCPNWWVSLSLSSFPCFGPIW